LEGIDRILRRPFSTSNPGAGCFSRGRNGVTHCEGASRGGWFLGLKPQAESVVTLWGTEPRSSPPSAEDLVSQKAVRCRDSQPFPAFPLFKVSVPVASLTKSPSATFEQFQDNNLAKNE
jgi:hypothetical protein